MYSSGPSEKKDSVCVCFFNGIIFQNFQNIFVIFTDSTFLRFAYREKVLGEYKDHPRRASYI